MGTRGINYSICFDPFQLLSHVFSFTLEATISVVTHSPYYPPFLLYLQGTFTLLLILLLTISRQGSAIASLLSESWRLSFWVLSIEPMSIEINKINRHETIEESDAYAGEHSPLWSSQSVTFGNEPLRWFNKCNLNACLSSESVLKKLVITRNIKDINIMTPRRGL